MCGFVLYDMFLSYHQYSPSANKFIQYIHIYTHVYIHIHTYMYVGIYESQT